MLVLYVTPANLAKGIPIDQLLACCLLFNDDETICKVTRWFMSTYQLTTDTYRLYAALHRLCQGPASWYNAAPSQKYLLRQVRAMDQGLPTKQLRHSEKSGNVLAGDQGTPIENVDMDIALLVLYGHILYSGRGYGYALGKSPYMQSMQHTLTALHSLSLPRSQ